MTHRILPSLLLFVTLPAFINCQSATRKVVYSAWETIGVEKRDLLKNEIEDTRDSQKEAGASFQDALERLRAINSLNNVDGGKLGKIYDRLKSSYEDAEKDASDVRKDILKVEILAGDLFKEWENEIGDIKNKDLKNKSREKLRLTQLRYKQLHASLKSTEARMDPVLSSFKDHVLFLKHNLNAQSLGSLKVESQKIQTDIQNLVVRMNESVAEADSFIKQIE